MPEDQVRSSGHQSYPSSIDAKDPRLCLSWQSSPQCLYPGRRRIRRIWSFIGGFLGIPFSLFILVKLTSVYPVCLNASCDGRDKSWPLLRTPYSKNATDGNEILRYLDLFGLPKFTRDAAIFNKESRHLLGSNDASREPQLVIAGKMTVDDGSCNIGQYNLKKKQWILSERIQLSLYNSYSGGEVYSLLANHTFLPSSDSETADDDSARRYVSQLAAFVLTRKLRT